MFRLKGAVFEENQSLRKPKVQNQPNEEDQPNEDTFEIDDLTLSELNRIKNETHSIKLKI